MQQDAERSMLSPAPQLKDHPLRTSAVSFMRLVRLSLRNKISHARCHEKPTGVSLPTNDMDPGSLHHDYKGDSADLARKQRDS